jgi:hypothetical protein
MDERGSFGGGGQVGVVWKQDLKIPKSPDLQRKI